MKYQIFMFFCLFFIHSVAAAALYRWVDDNGKVNYSDSVPPAKAQRGHTELDANGNRVKKVSAAKSKDQVKEEEWLEELADKLKTKQAQQKRTDALLLDSYASIKHFDEFYAERFRILSEEHNQLELLRDKLDEKLEKLLKQQEASESEADKKRIQGFIDITLENTQFYQDAIDQNVEKEKTTRSESEKLRKRFLQLKAKQERAELTVDSNS